MKIQVTKTMVNTLKKHLPKGYKIEYTTVNRDSFAWLVDLHTYKHEIDYDFMIDAFKVIVISYPDNYYACNKYITTIDLTRIFKKSDKTLDGFIKDFIEYIEV